MSPFHMMTVLIFKLYIILVLLIAYFQVSIFINQTLAIFYVKNFTLVKNLTAEYFYQPLYQDSR